MKKVLIGCLIILVLIVGLTIGVGWYLFVKARDFVGSYEGSFAQIQQVDEDFPWSPPAAEAPLNPQRFDQYLQVRSTIHDRLMRVRLFSELARAAEQETQANITSFQVMSVITEIPGILRDTVDAYRQQEMSFREFRYYSLESLRAIRAGAEAGDPEMQQLWEKLRGMATFMDRQLNTEDRTTTFDVSRPFDTMDTAGVQPQDIALVRENLSEFENSPQWYIVEIIFLNLLQGPASQ